MLFSRKKTRSFYLSPYLAGSQLEQVDSFKYLDNYSVILVGVLTLPQLPHLISSNVANLLYKSVIRPHLEYACQVWDPHLLKDYIQLLEGTQKFVLKVCIGN